VTRDSTSGRSGPGSQAGCLFGRARGRTTLAAGLTSFLAAGLEGAGGGLAAFGGDIALLVGIHGGEATAVRGLTALGGDLLDFFLGAVGEVSGVVVARHVDGWVL